MSGEQVGASADVFDLAFDRSAGVVTFLSVPRRVGKTLIVRALLEREKAAPRKEAQWKKEQRAAKGRR